MERLIVDSLGVKSDWWLCLQLWRIPASFFYAGE